MLYVVLALALVAVGEHALAAASGPQASEEARELNALSHQEIADHLGARSMGFEQLAERNGYPGPARVLDFAKDLLLSPAQRERTQAIFDRMQARAMAAGHQLVEEERALEARFAAKGLSSAELHDRLGAIAALQAEVRESQLQAYLEEAAVLSDAQIRRYRQLREYERARGAGKQPDHP